MSSASASSPSPSPASASPEVARLRQRFAELRRAEAAARVRLLGVVVVVVLLFAAFAYTTVSRVQGNFSQPAVQKAVAERLPHVVPPAGEQLQKALTNATPTYRKLAAERFEKIRPAFAARAQARLERIPAETGHMMSDTLHAAFAAAERRIEPEVKQTFPSLTDAQKQDLLNAYFHDAIAARDKELATHIDGIYTKELVAVHAALESFDLPRPEKAPTVETAQRDFLHTLLTLADFELLNADVPDTTTVAQRDVRPRTAATAPTTRPTASAK